MKIKNILKVAVLLQCSTNVHSAELICNGLKPSTQTRYLIKVDCSDRQNVLTGIAVAHKLLSEHGVDLLDMSNVVNQGISPEQLTENIIRAIGRCDDTFHVAKVSDISDFSSIQVIQQTLNVCNSALTTFK
jgi:hypothetical protein